ncbi:MAG: zinc-dependent peptidase, partial [Myxococcota bacterium]
MQRFNTRALLFHGATATVVASALGGLLALGGNAPIWLYPMLVLAAVAYVAFRMRRWIRRLIHPEPSASVGDILHQRVVFYRRLSNAEQERFRREAHYFLLDQNIVGVNIEVDDTLRVLTAASAVILTFGQPDYEWDTTRDILIYPTAYTEDYEHNSTTGTRLGQVGAQGPIILSAEAL